MESVPTDVIGNDLIRTYLGGIRRLEAIVADGLRRGLEPARLGTPAQRVGDATAAYRDRQLRAARAILAELERQGPRAAPVIAGRAYASAIYAVDRAAIGTAEAPAAIATRFGGIHQRAVQALAANMSGALEGAARQAGESVDAVFARAAALEAGVPPGAFPFVGRRVDDPWRRVSLDTIGEGLVTGDTRRQVTATMVDRLVREGTTDALTGFVDRAGRRWPLGTYAAMVTRTTTREATSRGAVNRMAEGGLDLVTISSHPHAADECDAYDGNTFSMSGDTPGYDVLDELPPFHPNCLHVVGPAAANLDAYEADLERAASGEADTATPADAKRPSSREAVPHPPADPERFAPKPLGERAVPSRNAGTAARLEEQRTRALIDRDPGPDPAAELARNAEHDRVDKLNRRGEAKYLRDNLGDDLAKFVDRKWAREERIRERYLAGELTTEDVEERAYEQYRREQDRTDLRAKAEQEAGFRKGSIPCFVCGRRKPRPSAVCDFCGDDPVTYGGTAAEFDRSYGYSGELGTGHHI